MLQAEAFGADIRDFKANEGLYHLLGGGEFVHNGSLMIDDVEDQSLKRRGEPCTYLKYGVDVAVNTGNFLYFCPYRNLGKFF